MQILFKFQIINVSVCKYSDLRLGNNLFQKSWRIISDKFCGMIKHKMKNCFWTIINSLIDIPKPVEIVFFFLISKRIRVISHARFFWRILRFLRILRFDSHDHKIEFLVVRRIKIKLKNKRTTEKSSLRYSVNNFQKCSVSMFNCLKIFCIFTSILKGYFDQGINHEGFSRRKEIRRMKVKEIKITWVLWF